jgi:hypothetical protein
LIREISNDPLIQAAAMKRKQIQSENEWARQALH